jgi:hypothetical protein
MTERQLHAVRSPFSVSLERVEEPVAGLAVPWAAPRNMLLAQTYHGHASIHDEDTARALGFQSATIEGPTHFSQIAPLGVALFGTDFLSRGCISAHYRSPAYEGDRTRALAGEVAPGSKIAPIAVVKDDGTEVLRGTVSIGPGDPPTALDERLAALRPLDAPAILGSVRIGMKTPPERVVMNADQPMGDLYPFSLTDKLKVITVASSWYDGDSSPWGRPIIPFEMISVLCQYRAAEHPLPIPPEAIGLFADQEIRLHDGPLFVGEEYELEREVVAISGSRRTESVWVRTTLRDASGKLAATMLLNQAYLKESVEHSA